MVMSRSTTVAATVGTVLSILTVVYFVASTFPALSTAQ